jgi:hypothetical protein
MRTWRAVVVLLGLATPALAENDAFLSRDGTVPAESYLESDAGELAAETSDSDWETFVEEKEAAPPGRFELPGPFPIWQTAPELQTLVVGPTFRNQEDRTEVGAAFGYINSKGRFPFELSIEPTWQRDKNVDGGDRHFARLRSFGLVEVWDRSSHWESTAFALTGFWGWQEESFHDLELGVSVSQTFGRRLSISGNLAWAGNWPDDEEFNDAVFGSVGVSYNLGAGLRVGGFYEPDNNYTHDDDWGGFVSKQVLPFAEVAVNAGKDEFVMIRLIISYALERE